VASTAMARTLTKGGPRPTLVSAMMAALPSTGSTRTTVRKSLSTEERQTLERGQQSTTLAAGLARRGKMLLLLAAGHSQSEVAQAVGVQRPVVRKWAKRFLAQRLDGLADAPGRGAKGGFPPRGCDPRGASGLRAPEYAGPQLVPVRWHRAGAPAHRGGDR
jgi:hypothetical protein